MAFVSYLSLFVSLVAIAVSAVLFLWKVYFSPSEPNPFSRDCRKRRRPLVTDQTANDRVLKQGFTSKKIPEHLDAIVIGSGIGGLTTAAILAKAGKKVLVLEQHDRAGGCTHTFTEKGFEFDVGIHYIGDIHTPSFFRVLLDQISYGQIQWSPLDKSYDKVVLNEGDNYKEVDIKAGDELRESLLEAFPKEQAAIDKFLKDVQGMRKSMLGLMLMKLLPMWVAKLMYWSGLLDKYTSYPTHAAVSAEEYAKSLTNDVRLRAVFNYAYFNYGTTPDKASVMMSATMINHYRKGASYPVGGASQIALNIIPVIEDAGGRVLVRAKVTNVLTENGRVVGVRVSKGQIGEPINIYAPTVISNAGVMNTKSMLPNEVFANSHLSSILSDGSAEVGPAALSLFVGLNGSTEELGLKPQNIWTFTDSDLSQGCKKYMSQQDIDVDKMKDIPMLVITFPSSKDPSWKERHPGKTTMSILTLANIEWFKHWRTEKVKHRGQSYENLKEAIGRQMWLQVLKLYPQLEDRVEYFEVGSPLSNNYYLGSTQGEIYGLDHTMSRFHPKTAIKLRPNTGIPGLYLSGQDVLMCGFFGGMMGGLLTAGAVLNRNVYKDCDKLYKKLLEAGLVM